VKYLKKYKLFLEADEFEIGDSDTPDVVMSKEKMNTTMSQMKEYKVKKSQIDALYAKEGADIEKELESILGKTDVQNGVDRNPFLVEYAHLSKLQKDINKLQDDNSNDKIKIDDLQQSLSLSEDDATKKAVEFKISDIKNRMSERYSKINEIQQDLVKKEKDHKEKMVKMEKDMRDSVKNLSSQEQK
jgi:hypothetical protein